MNPIRCSKVHLATLVGLGALCGAVLASDAARADEGSMQAPIPIYPCAVGAPDATRTMGPNVNSVTSSSAGGAYGAKPLCRAWVVDINVPSTSSGTAGWGKPISFGGLPETYGANNKAECEATAVVEQLFRKPQGATSFTRIAGGTRRGVWTQGDMFPCILAPQAGFVPFPKVNPPNTGTVVYRVSRSLKQGATYKGVTISAEHQQPPPT